MKRNGKLFTLCIGIVLAWLVACTSSEQANLEPVAIAVTRVDTAEVLPTPTLVMSTESVEATATAVPTLTPAEELPATAIPIVPTATAVLTTDDEAQLRQELQILAFPADLYEGVYAAPLPHDPAVWLVHSLGLRPYENGASHALALYRHEAAQWQELARTNLTTPDMLQEGAITSVDLGDGRFWLEVRGFIGAHGSCYELLHDEAKTLVVALSQCHSSNASDGIGDLNQDGRPDVVLNQTDDYVFCFACGVRYPAYTVYEFVAGDWQLVTVNRLPNDVEPDVRDKNNEAVRLYEMGLFKQAAETINAIVADVPTVLWNQAIINLHTDVARFQAQSGPYPLLGHIFYGDYAAALAVMRAYQPAQLFTLQNNPLTTGTLVEGWENTLGEWITKSSTPVIEGQPDMAAAHFLYAWGLYLTDPTEARIITALETAVTLDPNEPLYQNSLAYLRGE